MAKGNGARRYWLAGLVAVLCLNLGHAIGEDKPAGNAPNRLAKENSPYLRQHARNPIDWYPWGPEAFEKARKENKIIFVSIGYSACHWCHVMELESFNNPEIGRILNQSFVCIKVDREERPDLDQIFLASLQCFGVPGGWPISVFLTPEGKPFYGGTYWPAEARVVQNERMAGFKDVLQAVLSLEKEHPKEIRAQADQVVATTAQIVNQTAKKLAPEPRRHQVQAVTDALRADFDPLHGGFGSPIKNFKGPKFPASSSLEFLALQAKKQKSEELLGLVKLTLERMGHGGIYDQLAGGFHRYSTDRAWKVPHFEKMLNDNAQLAALYTLAYQQTRDPFFKQIARETLAFVQRELTSPEGLFFSAIAADSDGEEGRYYLWTAPEIAAALPRAEQLKLARTTFLLGELPNHDNRYYLLQRVSTRQASEDAAIEEIRARLLAARDRRTRPLVDTKALVSWNGQMIAAFALAGQVFEEPAYLATARKAAEQILATRRTPEGRLSRAETVRTGTLPRAFLDDYAFLAHGLLNLHDATNEPRWLEEARSLTDVMIRHFRDDTGGFFYTADDHEKLFARSKELFDGAQPTGNSMAARNLVRLAAKTNDARYLEQAYKTLRAFLTLLEQFPGNLSAMAIALDQYLDAAPARTQSGGVTTISAYAMQGTGKRSDAVVKCSAKATPAAADGKTTITITLAIDKEWHLYANPVGNESLDSSQTTVGVTSKVKPASVKIEYPKGKTIKDAIVGDYAVYDGQVEIQAVVQKAAGSRDPLEVTVKFQACSEKTCLVPATVKLSVP